MIPVPEELLRAVALRLERSNRPDAQELARQTRALIPQPPTQEYYVLFKVKYQPEESADPDVETPPMDMTHQLECVDPRYVTYGMEQIGTLLHVRDWLLEQGVDLEQESGA